MTILQIRDLEYTYDTNNQVIGTKPAVTLPLDSVESVRKHRNGNIIFSTKQGPAIKANRPLSMVFGDVLKQQGVSEILNELPVYDEYFYKGANGKTIRAFDKRSAASFVPVGK